MHSPDPIADIIGHLKGARPSIKCAPDPGQPNRLFYHITGDTREAVQSAITELMNKVDDGFGYAVFDGPRRCEGGYVAQGAVVLYSTTETNHAD